jgi:hypothetical protein
MAKNPVIRFSTLNNRLKATAFPIMANGKPDTGRLFNAVNVQFSDTGDVMLPCQGVDSVYAGATCTSLNVSDAATLFVEGGNLKRLTAVDTASAVLSTVGSSLMRYTRPVGDSVYFANNAVTGKFTKGDTATKHWGIPVPTHQPTCTATTTGDMYGGEYRVAITWIGNSESGTGLAARLTVPEGGGIALSALPTAPSYVTAFAVWLSSVNGKDLYLYDEYPIATTTVTLTQRVGAIVLDTQFGYPPAPTAASAMVQHYGRIYYSLGALLYYTHIGANGPRYDIQMAGNFYPFDGSTIKTVVSCPGVLYVGTERMIYKITNIDGDGPATLEPLQDCGTVFGSECYDPDGVSAYFMSHRGLIRATPEGLIELNYADVAMPFYAAGTSAVTELGGVKYLLFFGTGGTKNPLADSDWNTQHWGDTTSETSGWAINLVTGAVSEYRNYSYTAISNSYACSAAGLQQFSTSYAASGYIQTAKLSFGSSFKKRVSDAYVNVDGGATTLTMTTDNSTIDYDVRATDINEYVWVDLARGANGQHWQATLANTGAELATATEIELVTILIPRH